MDAPLGEGQTQARKLTQVSMKMKDGTLATRGGFHRLGPEVRRVKIQFPDQQVLDSPLEFGRDVLSQRADSSDIHSPATLPFHEGDDRIGMAAGHVRGVGEHMDDPKIWLRNHKFGDLHATGRGRQDPKACPMILSPEQLKQGDKAKPPAGKEGRCGLKVSVSQPVE